MSILLTHRRHSKSDTLLLLLLVAASLIRVGVVSVVLLRWRSLVVHRVVVIRVVVIERVVHRQHG